MSQAAPHLAPKCHGAGRSVMGEVEMRMEVTIRRPQGCGRRAVPSLDPGTEPVSISRSGFLVEAGTHGMGGHAVESLSWAVDFTWSRVGVVYLNIIYLVDLNVQALRSRHAVE